MAQNPPANAGVRVGSLGLEDPLEEEMATHSGLENPMDRGAWCPRGHERAAHNLATEQQTV